MNIEIAHLSAQLPSAWEFLFTIILTTADFLLKWITLEREGYSRAFLIGGRGALGWGIQHDEKFIAQDAKWLLFQDDIPQQPTDYKLYPVMASFGIGGPLLATLGFRLFGLNNRGLRFALTLISSLSTLLFILSVFIMIHGPLGILVSVLWVCNWNTFLFGRCSVLEHVFLLSCNAGFFIFISGLNPILPTFAGLGFFCALTLLIKWSFVFQFCIFMAALLLGNGSFILLVAFFAGSITGCIVFGVPYMLFLKSTGIWNDFLRNISSVFFQHRGKKSLCKEKKPIGGKWALTNYTTTFIGWLFNFNTKEGDEKTPKAILSTCILLTLCFLGTCNPDGLGLGIYHVISLTVFHFISIYLKRTSSLFPYTLLLTALGIQVTFNFIFGEEALHGQFAWTAVIVMAIVQCWQQYLTMTKHGMLIPSPLGDAAKAIDEIVGKNEVVYAHAFAYRLFWQCRSTRLRAYDEQFLDDLPTIIAWCINEGHRFLLLPEFPNAPLPLEIIALFKERWRTHIPLHVSDPENDYILYEIVPYYR